MMIYVYLGITAPSLVCCVAGLLLLGLLGILCCWSAAAWCAGGGRRPWPVFDVTAVANLVSVFTHIVSAVGALDLLFLL